MSSLREIDRRPLERLLEMSGGYVLDFTDRTFAEFFQDEANVNIHSARYTSHGLSKANKLRAFWRVESDSLVGSLVGKTLMALIDCSIESLTEMSTDHYALVEQCRSIAQRLMATGPNLGTLKDRAVTLNAVHLVEQIRRMEQSIDADPALAVGTAKELVETVCKTILAERGKPAAGTPDLPTLAKMTMRELRLMPDGVPSAAKGAETAKRILGNLATIAQGLAELRNLYGTGHGRHEDTGSIKPRHAKLAVGAAATLATFLFETHKEVV